MKKTIIILIFITFVINSFSQTERNRATLRGWFETGDKPTQSQFQDLIESMYNFQDDGALSTILKTSDTTTLLVTITQLNDSLAVFQPDIDSLEDVKFIDFDTTQSSLDYQNGRLYFDYVRQNLVFYNNQTGSSWDIGREGRLLAVNNTGSQIDNGEVVYISGDSDGIRTIALANAKWDSTATATIGFATVNIANGDTGEVALWGEINDLNTTGCTTGEQIYLDTMDGGWRTTQLESPNWLVQLGNCGKVDNDSGSINASIEIRSKTQSVIGIFNGAILESHTITMLTDGSTVKLSLANDGDFLTLFFDATTYRFSVPDTIQLTAGNDVSPTRNWVYIPESTKALTVSTVGFPSDEQFIPIADILVQSAASAQTYGVYKVHAWTDHITDAVGQGHMSHINKWIRTQNATWLNGVEPTVTVGTNGGGKDTIKWSSTSGNALQLHEHAYPAQDLQNGNHAHVINDETTPYTVITDLGAITTDTEGNTLESNNTFYSLVAWGSISEDSVDCQLFVNKPSGSYSTETGVTNDANRYSIYTIPIEYRGTGFLIARINIRYQTSGSGTFTIIDTEDLRGLFPPVGAGSGTPSSSSIFYDNVFQVQNVTDNTKILEFDVSGVTTGTTRTLTVPDSSGIVALKEHTVQLIGDSAYIKNAQVDTLYNEIIYSDSSFNKSVYISENATIETDASRVKVDSNGDIIFESTSDGSTFIPLLILSKDE